MGTEPGASRKPWDSAKVRWLIAASWPYYHSTGNQSIPAVCATVNNGREDFYADRFYLPETPRDLRSLERAGIPVFGIESRHQARDFDVIGTSISYAVLWMNFCKMLKISGIPLRWRDRQEHAGDYPMVVAGGQAYCAPGFMEPVADCIFLGEVEDEPGNGGLSQVCARIAQFKEEGTWNASRVGCYERLAREFNYLFFPRFVETFYRYEDRGLPELSRQVSGYRSLLDGMRMPFRSRTVKNLDSVASLTEAPLLYADPRMGAGDIEVARGCPAWCSFCRLSWVSKPYRQRSVEKSVEHAKVWQRNMGSVELSPFGPDFPMHSVPLSTYVTTDSGVLSIAELLDGKRVEELPFGAGVQVRGRMEPLLAAYHTRTSPVCVVDYSHGLQVHATQEHLIRVVTLGPRRTDRKGREVGQRAWLDSSPEAWREVRELQPGDWVRCYYGREQWAEEQVHLDAGQELTPGAAWLLGLLSGDGSFSPALPATEPSRIGRPRQHPAGEPYWVDFRVTDPGVAARARVELHALGFPFRERNDRGVPTIGLASAFVRWLSQFGVRDNSSKRQVPEQVRRSPQDVVAAYVTGCLDADGSVPDRQSAARHLLEVVHSTGSESFARELVPLVLALGHPVSLHRLTGGSGAPGWNLVLHTAVDADWSWLRFSETGRAALIRDKIADGLHRPHKMFPGTGMDGVYYAKVASVSIDSYTAEVGDVEVPSARCFNVNGMVVHNTQKKELLTALLENVNSSIDVTAMRIDDFNADDQYVLIQARAGADGVTLGLEGLDQRMRDLVGKGTADKDVEEAVIRGIRAGFRKFKLFMINNLPGEEPGDVMRIVELGRRLAAIRDELGQQHVVIQMSFTPLLIEAATPFQWFAPTPPDHALIAVAEEFRDLNIQFKIGTKAEPNKVALFQLCQRASCDVGEAITDVFEELDTACWGGVPKDTRDRLEAALRRRGFRNGLADCFDERSRYDLFGWEYIDTGVSADLLWDVYRQMTEFLEGTDAETYESRFAGPGGGNEWVPRCDEKCQGNACGACDGEDLKLRAAYIRKADRDTDLSRVKVIDQSSVAFRVRARLEVPPENRFVTREHWKYAVRRAAYRAQHDLDWKTGIAKKTVQLASDACKHRDWACGTDYAEFGMTWRPPSHELYGVHGATWPLSWRRGWPWGTGTSTRLPLTCAAMPGWRCGSWSPRPGRMR